MYLLHEYKNELVTMIGTSMNKYLDQQCVLTHNLNYLSYFYHFHPLHITNFKELFNRLLSGDITKIQETITGQITTLEDNIGGDIKELQPFITNITGSIKEFKTIKTDLENNIPKIENELSSKFDEIKQQIQKSICNSKQKLQNYIGSTIIRQLEDSQKKIKGELDTKIKEVKGELTECNININKLETKTKEIQNKLEKVDIGKIVKLSKKDAKEVFKWNIIPYFGTDSQLILKELKKINNPKRIEHIFSSIKKYLNSVQSSITPIKQQIKSLSTFQTDENGNKYEKSLKDFEYLKNKFPKFDNDLNRYIETSKSYINWLDVYITPLIKVKGNVNKSQSMRSEVKQEIEEIIEKLKDYKTTRDNNFKIIDQKHKELKDFIKNNRDNFEKIEKYTPIYGAVKKYVDQITLKLTEYQDNLSKIEPNILDNHFHNIEQQKKQLKDDPGDHVRDASENIIKWKDTNKQRITDMKDLWDKLNNIEKIGELNFNTDPNQFKIDSLVSYSQDITTIKGKYEYIDGLKSVLDNIQSGISKLEKMRKILKHMGNIIYFKNKLNDFIHNFNSLKRHIIVIFHYTNWVNHYITKMKEFESGLSNLDDLKDNIYTLKSCIRYIRIVIKYINKVINDSVIIRHSEQILNEYDNSLEMIKTAIESIKSANTGNTLGIHSEVTQLTDITSKIDDLKTKIKELNDVKTKIIELQDTLSTITDGITNLESNIKGLESSIESVVKTFLHCSNESSVCILYKLSIDITNNIVTVPDTSTRSTLITQSISLIRKSLLSYLWIIMSHITITEYKLLVSRLYHFTSITDKILFIIQRAEYCYCVINLSPESMRSYTIMSSLKLDEDNKSKIKSIINNFYLIHNEGNHFCLCMVIKWVLYPTILKCTCYFIDSDLDLLSGITRKLDRYGYSNSLTAGVPILVRYAIDLMDIINKMLEKYEGKFGENHPYFYCRLENTKDSYYIYFIALIIYICYLVEHLLSLDNETISGSIQCLSTLMNDLELSCADKSRIVLSSIELNSITIKAYGKDSSGGKQENVVTYFTNNSKCTKRYIPLPNFKLYDPIVIDLSIKYCDIPSKIEEFKKIFTFYGIISKDKCSELCKKGKFCKTSCVCGIICGHINVINSTMNKIYIELNVKVMFLVDYTWSDKKGILLYLINSNLESCIHITSITKNNRMSDYTHQLEYYNNNNNNDSQNNLNLNPKYYTNKLILFSFFVIHLFQLQCYLIQFLDRRYNYIFL